MRDDLANRILTAATTRLGEPVSLTREGSSYQLHGIFSQTFSDVDVDTGLRVTTEVPTLIVNASDIAIEPSGNDRVTIANGETYLVREVRRDGEGGLILLMYQSAENNYL